MPRVIIQTGARLHFGLLPNQPQAGRLFGGAGAMIDSPGFVVAAERAERAAVAVSCDDVSPAACHEIERRVVEIILPRVTESGIGSSDTFRIQIRQCIPPHVGLGAGTQLALAVAKAIATLAGDRADEVELATRVGRGARSAVGIHGFAQGGLIVDGGKGRDESAGVLAVRTPLPAGWRFVLISPVNTRGLSGEAERDAFGQLPPMNTGQAKRLMTLADQELINAAKASDFHAFSEALFEFGRTVGEYFAPVQGGIFAHPEMRKLAAVLRDWGIRGIAQTSWGPTLFAVAKSVDMAEELAQRISADPSWSHLSLRIAAPRNRGASVEMEG